METLQRHVGHTVCTRVLMGEWSSGKPTLEGENWRLGCCALTEGAQAKPKEPLPDHILNLKSRFNHSQ